MTDLKVFDSIKDWKLKKGSHLFPGPDGGTCINEAAIVAAGLKYKTVRSISDCPPCFCPTIAAYALALNDSINDDETRNSLLMPFVTKLAGTADKEDIERQRAEFIVLTTIREILPGAFYRLGDACASYDLSQSAYRCATAIDIFDAELTVNALHKEFGMFITKQCQDALSFTKKVKSFNSYMFYPRAAYDAVLIAVEFNKLIYGRSLTQARTSAPHKLKYDCGYLSRRYQTWKICASILERAIKIGNHSSVEEIAAIENMKKVLEAV